MRTADIKSPEPTTFSVPPKVMQSPLEPKLASSLWLPQEETTSKDAAEPPTKRRKVVTGTPALDTALDGGLKYGEIHCITAEPSCGATEIVQALLAQHLSSDEEATATVIDSTISLDVQSLFEAIQASRKAVNDASQETMQALSRLKIMKVFDITGLSQAAEEVRERLEKSSTQTAVEDDVLPQAPRGTIPDSQDEEDDMLEVAAPIESPEPPPPDEPDLHQEAKPVKELLIIDNISQLLGPSLRNNYARGQSLLATFMRSLGRMTRATATCTVLIGHAANAKAADEEEMLSFFGRCKTRSSFGLGFGHLLDVHIFLYMLPLRKPRSDDPQGKGVEMVRIMEVVQDRHGARRGFWAPFGLDSAGMLRDLS